MFNPVILGHEGEYQAEESCLSLKGARATTRWERITVRYQDESFAWHTEQFSG